MRALPFAALLLVLAGCGSRLQDPPACALGDGRTCPLGAVCADGAGCNVCQCAEEGEVGCTAVICQEPATAICSADSDCAEGRCIYDVGCEGSGQGYCAQVSCETFSPNPRAYCACAGTTFNSVCPDRPYQSVGECS